MSVRELENHVANCCRGFKSNFPVKQVSLETLLADISNDDVLRRTLNLNVLWPSLSLNHVIRTNATHHHLFHSLQSSESTWERKNVKPIFWYAKSTVYVIPTFLLFPAN